MAAPAGAAIRGIKILASLGCVKLRATKIIILAAMPELKIAGMMKSRSMLTVTALPRVAIDRSAQSALAELSSSGVETSAT